MLGNFHCIRLHKDSPNLRQILWIETSQGNSNNILPYEIVWLIAKCLAPDTLFNLSRCDRHCKGIIKPILCQNICIQSIRGISQVFSLTRHKTSGFPRPSARSRFGVRPRLLPIMCGQQSREPTQTCRQTCWTSPLEKHAICVGAKVKQNHPQPHRWDMDLKWKTYIWREERRGFNYKPDYFE